MNSYMVDGVPHERRGWTDDEIDLVRVKWAAGWSASQIASKLEGRTRNSVISLVDRKAFTRAIRNTNQHSRGVEPAAPYVRKPRGEVLKEQRRQRKLDKPTLHLPKEPKRSTMNGRHLFTAKADPAAVNKYDTPSDGAGIRFDELTNSTCRWPKGTPGEPDFAFCGCAGADFNSGRPYCAPHDRASRERRTQ